MKNAEEIVIRGASVFLIVVVIIFYNHTLLLREKDLQIAELNAQLHILEQSNANSENTVPTQGALYQDGVYLAEGQGFGGIIKTEVLIENGKIASVTILAHDNEDEAYFAMAERLADEIVKAQSVELDAVSGATFSSQGILEAVTKALEEAKNQA